MSVESEILRIQHNIADTYAAVADKGGEVPLQPTSAKLAAAVASIPAIGGSGEIYSTEEQRIGTWIDGKPLYRRVTEEKRTAGVAVNTIFLNGWDIDFIVSLRGLTYSYGVHKHIDVLEPLPTYDASLGYDYDGETQSISYKNTTLSPRYARFIIEYTKTTDTVPASIEANGVTILEAQPESLTAMPVTAGYSTINEKEEFI